jgi:C-terminal processing protease CtpA/Prc
MFEAVDDPYTSYLDGQDYSNLMMSTRGSYGVLASLSQLTMTDLLPSSLRLKEHLVKEPALRRATGFCVWMTRQSAATGSMMRSDLMRGEPDTEVVLELIKRNQSESIELTVMRETITNPVCPF